MAAYGHEVLVGRLAMRRPWRTRHIDRIRRVVVHRCSVTAASGGTHGDDPGQVAEWFRQSMRWPGHPYHFQVSRRGLVWQCNALDARTYGAAGWNTSSVHVSVVGDFRSEAPAAEQLRVLALLLSDLLSAHGSEPWSVCGHGELNPLKRCPGRHLSMGTLREAVGCAMLRSRPEGWRWWLETQF